MFRNNVHHCHLLHYNYESITLPCFLYPLSFNSLFFQIGQSIIWYITQLKIKMYGLIKDELHVCHNNFSKHTFFFFRVFCLNLTWKKHFFLNLRVILYCYFSIGSIDNCIGFWSVKVTWIEIILRTVQKLLLLSFTTRCANFKFSYFFIFATFYCLVTDFPEIGICLMTLLI